MKKTIIPILSAAVWISISEFVRNQFIVRTQWMSHYQSLGLIFPSEPVNGAVWGLWSLLFASAVFILNTKFTMVQTGLFAWFIGFVLMWVVIGNLGVLPYNILPYAIPLSLLESFGAAWIIRRLSTEYPGRRKS